MSVFIITYDILNVKSDYDSLFNVLKSANSYYRLFGSVWLVKTEESIEQWNEKIKKVTNNPDQFFISEVTHQMKQGWVKKGAWEWLKKYD